jgi:hypothetical protein
MLRACLNVALALSVLAPAGIAAADDGMCFTRAEGGLWSRVERIEQSFEVGPFFSSDGAGLASEVVERVSLRLERERRSPAGEVLWCWSANDPRCSPADSAPEDGPRAIRTARLVGVVIDHSARWPELDSASLSAAPHDEDRPSDGVRARVERPPRA